MTICSPFKGATISSITQPFGNIQSDGKPHSGTDWAKGYGTWLVAPEDCVVLSIMNATTISTYTDNLARGYGIRMVSVANPNIHHVFWHCLPVFPVGIGDSVAQGEEVAQMGNSGFVLAGGQIVPVELRSFPPFPGTHLHQEIIDNQKGEFMDVVKYIDFSIPIKNDWLKEAMLVIMKIRNMFNQR